MGKIISNKSVKGVLLLLNFYTVMLLLLATIILILFNITSLLLCTLLVINTLIICIGFYISLQRKIISIDLIYWIFNNLYFYYCSHKKVYRSFFQRDNFLGSLLYFMLSSFGRENHKRVEQGLDN